jgi:hypothetical protein
MALVMKDQWSRYQMPNGLEAEEATVSKEMEYRS